MAFNAEPNEPTSNSYVSEAEADDYHAVHLYASVWNSATSPNKEIALQMATRILDEKIEWVGNKNTQEQALAWSRNGVTDDGYDVLPDVIPKAVKNATAEFARHLLKSDLTDSSITDPAILSKIKVDEIELSYNKQQTGQQQVNTTGVIPLIVQEMLRGWGEIFTRESEAVNKIITVNLLRV